MLSEAYNVRKIVIATGLCSGFFILIFCKEAEVAGLNV